MYSLYHMWTVCLYVLFALEVDGVPLRTLCTTFGL